MVEVSYIIVHNKRFLFYSLKYAYVINADRTLYGKTAQIHTQTDLHSGDFFGCNIIGPPKFKGNKLFLLYHTSSKTISNK